MDMEVSFVMRVLTVLAILKEVTIPAPIISATPEKSPIVGLATKSLVPTIDSIGIGGKGDDKRGKDFLL